MNINLTVEEIETLIEALDSVEYWEYRDILPHDSGSILDPTYMVDPPELDEEQLAALEDVRAIRALADRLQKALTGGE